MTTTDVNTGPASSAAASAITVGHLDKLLAAESTVTSAQFHGFVAGYGAG